MLTCTCYKILLVEPGLPKKKKKNLGEEKALINGFMPIMRD